MGQAGPAARVRIAVIEDDPILRAHVAEAIAAAEGFVLIGAAETLAEGLLLLEAPADLLLLDLGLPDGSGLEVLRAARARGGAELKIIVVSVFGDVSNVVQAIEGGADGYVLKGEEGPRIIDAIRSVLAGGAPLSAAAAAHVLAKLRDRAGPPGEGPNPLTPTEVQVLRDLSKGFSYREVAGLRGVTYYTIADHVKSIYRKLRVNSRSEAVFEAVQTGLIRMTE
ncbi:MAG TPA: response regulator transcription factor [Caulobacter sp.]|nr:response regulator transcription factor [Caulobacter sp.]